MERSKECDLGEALIVKSWFIILSFPLVIKTGNVLDRDFMASMGHSVTEQSFL